MGFPQMGRVGVIGAGSTGLTVGWYLQQAGAEVHLLDRVGVAGGSSRGNAGWLTPPLAGPLPQPGILRYGLRALLHRRSPLHVSLRPSRSLIAFLTKFTLNATPERWSESLRHLASINAMAFDAFDELEDGGVQVHASSVDILAVGRHEGELQHLADEMAAAHELGLPGRADLITAEIARELEPQLSEQVGAGLLLSAQRTFDPAAFCENLAHSVRQRGGQIFGDVEVTEIVDTGSDVEVLVATGESLRFDALVVATGAWLNGLVRPFGVTVPVQSGRGYSFTVADRPTIGRPVYLPAQRVVCTPMANGTRVAGTMELGSPDAPFRHARVRQIADSVSPYLIDGVRRTVDDWCGSRPCSADGLPLVGRTTSSRVFVHGGHGMWGMTQGPATARLLAEGMTKDVFPPELRPFDPLR